MSDIRITTLQVKANELPWEADSWIDGAVDHMNRLSSVFSGLGIDASSLTSELFAQIGKTVVQYPEEFAPYSDHRRASGKGRFQMLSTIKSWFTGLKVVEEDAAIITQQVPLCVFNCPAVPKARTLFETSESEEDSATWSVEVFGSGFGADVTVSIAQSSEFEASPGEKKLVFAPLKLRLVKAALLKRGQLQARFLRSELAESEGRDANGIRTVNKAEWQQFVVNGQPVRQFDLSGDRSDDVATYSYGYDMSASFESKLGLKAFDLESSVSAKCIAKRTAKLTLELPAGRLYQLRRPQKISGFYF